VTHCLIKHQLKCLVVEFFCLLGNTTDDLLDMGLVLVLLLDCELVTRGFRDFQEGVAGHLHYAWELLFHELEQFLYNCAKEGPVVA
jgi:hypothetical protein